MKTNRKIKSILAALLTVTMCIAMAGCESGNNGEPAETKATTTAAEEADNAEEMTTVTDEKPSPDLPAPKEEDRVSAELKEQSPDRYTYQLVPDTPKNLADDINLTEFTLTDHLKDPITVDFYDATVKDIKDQIKYFTMLPNYRRINLKPELFFFYGERFSTGTDGLAAGCNLEVMEDGKVVYEYDWENKEDVYKVKAIYVATGLDGGVSKYITFTGGIAAGQTKDEIEKVLGKGYETEITEPFPATYSYYKNTDATMIICYLEDMTADSIVVVIND